MVYLVSLLLFTAFAAIHSLTAAERVKGRALKHLSSESYRLLYNALSVVTLTPFAYIWVTQRAQAELLYSFSGLPMVLILLVKLGGALIFMAAFLQMGTLEFSGLKEEGEELIDSGLYRWVRHPQYLGGLIFIWSAPSLNLLDLENYILLTLYLVIGARLEERKLEKKVPGYRYYKERVPFLLPRARR